MNKIISLNTTKNRNLWIWKVSHNIWNKMSLEMKPKYKLPIGVTLTFLNYLNLHYYMEVVTDNTRGKLLLAKNPERNW